MVAQSDVTQWHKNWIYQTESPTQLFDWNSKSGAAQELLKRRLARTSLLDFTLYTKPDYRVNWHHQLVCSKLDQFAAGEIKRLIISMPPRHGKSELVSRRLPAYLFGRNPDTSIIACSYSSDLSSRMNRDVQRVIDAPEYAALFPQVRLSSSNSKSSSHGSYLRNSDIFEVVKKRGVYRSAGVGGGITGMGFKYGIIDDPIKNREEAESSTIREKIWEWYTDTFYTRQEEDASILITMTRWHEDDLVGRLLDLAERDEEADQWEIVTLPAMSEKVRPEYDIRTGIDQALWKGKYPERVLRKMKATVPLYTWLSLYQQRPSAVNGNLFKREFFKYASLQRGILDLGGVKKYAIESCKIFQTCDPAASTRTTADYFVLGTWAQTPNNELVLLDLLRTRLESPDQVELFKQQYQRWHPVQQWCEAVGVGKTLYQMLVRTGLPMKELVADTDKVTRALPAAARMQAGTIYFLEDADYRFDLETELLAFPNGAHDDQVDVLSYAVQVVIESLNGLGDLDLSSLIRTKKKR